MNLSPMDAREFLGWAGAWMNLSSGGGLPDPREPSMGWTGERMRLSSGGAFQTQESPWGRAGAWMNLSLRAYA